MLLSSCKPSSPDFIDRRSFNNVDVGEEESMLPTVSPGYRIGGEADTGGGVDGRRVRRGGNGGFSSLVGAEVVVSRDSGSGRGISSEWIRCKGGIDFCRRAVDSEEAWCIPLSTMVLDEEDVDDVDSRRVFSLHRRRIS